MREPVTFSDVLDLEMSYDEAQGEQLLPLARELLALAEDPHPADDHAPSALLAMAGQYFGDAGDAETAEQVLRRAIDLDDRGGVDPRCFLIELYLETGRDEEALALDNETRRSRPLHVVTYSVLGQLWSSRDPRRALGWFNRGLDLAERTGEDDSATYSLLCVGRYHVRRGQGQDLDEYDEIAVDTLDSAWQDGTPED
ncbi:hypothetical protein MWU75_09895 [Ornithinimicrobium sp. F0845]|uniref:hypothetical protein n=1 Tax=Ornithinimicrobium sp. F0845 TaxID=2926412 RepID=UPI001FF64EDB|nr:hypothetical protein [Ornithinimicrobium sp. F0845]MCK0112449.1 hypothetical protein [Ornithinimicrobium sp. F0845]